MNIKDVKTCRKVGDFNLRYDHSRNKIGLKYSNNREKSYLISDDPRIYLITVDGIIKKIGGSASKGGIIATMNFYVSAMTGSPGVPRFVIHLLIERFLKEGKKVELFMITSPSVEAIINGLFSYKIKKIASFKEMEDFCKSDYYRIEKKYPEWNFQENKDKYPEDLARLHNEYHKKRLNK